MVKSFRAKVKAHIGLLHELLMVKKEQIRTCIVTRKSGGKEELIRFVIGPDEIVIPDIMEKLPGRGVWVTNSKEIVQQAYKRKLFAAGFKQRVNVDGIISRNIEDLLLDNVKRGLSMAKKSGLVIAGFSKVESLARRGEIQILFHACDGKNDGLAKIKSALIACQAGGGYENGLPQPFTGLSSARLDAALGMSNSVHVALVGGGATGSLKKQIRRFNNYCS
jgi:predicted RNA-binding protein YlxR (DUF448 family)